MTLDREWHPCLWCGAPIDRRRLKDALMRGQQPKYCGEPCRRNTPANSLVHNIWAAALGADPNKESLWKAVFDERVAYATAPFKAQKGRTKK